MAKAIGNDVKESAAGGEIRAEDLKTRPIRLMMLSSSVETFESETTGKSYDKVTFIFKDNQGEERTIKVLSFDSLVREMVNLDPDVGDVLELSTEYLPGSKYPLWTVKRIRKSSVKSTEASQKEQGEAETERTTARPSAKKPARKNETVSEEEEIRIEDIPF